MADLRQPQGSRPLPAPGQGLPVPLTPQERAQLDATATLASRFTLVFVLLTLALLMAAIWVGDWRFAATGGLTLGATLVATATAGYARSPECAKRVAARRRTETEE